jgi:hypothetical protein
VAARDRGDDSDSDDSLFNDDDNAGDGEAARAIEAIRRKRIAELQSRAASSGGRRGLLMELRPENFAEEVIGASHQGFVVLLVHLDAHGPSEVLRDIMAELSNRFPSTKMLQMVHCDALSNVPRRDCPILMVYHKGRPVRQFATLAAFGANKPTAEDVEWALAKLGAVPSELNEDPREAALFK